MSSETSVECGVEGEGTKKPESEEQNKTRIIPEFGAFVLTALQLAWEQDTLKPRLRIADLNCNIEGV